MNKQTEEGHVKSIGLIANALTVFAFRNGPVETMHANPNSQLSDLDMKILNKYISDKLAYIIELTISGNIDQLEKIIKHHSEYCRNWDIPDYRKEQQEISKIKKDI